MHKVQSILEQIKTKLSDLQANKHVSEILDNTASIPIKFPCLIITMGDDDLISRQSSNISQHLLEVFIDIIIQTNTPAINSILLNIREQVEIALLTDHTIGLPFIINTEFTGQFAPEYTGDSEVYTGSMRMRFTFEYRTITNNPSV